MPAADGRERQFGQLMPTSKFGNAVGPAPVGGLRRARPFEYIGPQVGPIGPSDPGSRSNAMAKSTVRPSPFAPARLPDVPVVPGVRLAACEAGIRYANRTDLMMAVLEPGTTVAGVLTQSKTCSAPVLWCRSSLAQGLGARAGGQLRQRQCLHRQEGRRGHAHDGGGRCSRRGLCARRGLRGIHGRHRRAARCRQVRPSARGLAKAAAPEGWHEAAEPS